ncbi:MAG: hypothetical protein JKY37_13490, partial [Nannocystaceae bacterium]|nr:hypothetical protein [Nannocystaceae bacterium]
MVHAPLTIDDDIRRAEPPPTALYDDAVWWQRIKCGLLQRTWHVIGPASAPPSARSVSPQTLLPG